MKRRKTPIHSNKYRNRNKGNQWNYLISVGIGCYETMSEFLFLKPQSTLRFILGFLFKKFRFGPGKPSIIKVFLLGLFLFGFY